MEQIADTLICDTGRIAMWQSNPDFDYNRDLVRPEVDLIQWISSWFGDWLSRIFGHTFASKYTEVVLIVLFVLVVALIVWFVYRKRPELFMRSRKYAVAYSVENDTIYGVDFEKEIADALSQNDFKEASRLLYLQTLKWLTDEGRIDWQLYKTPTEYIYEIKVEEQRFSFRRLTNRFLRARYGNFGVTESDFREMEVLQQEMMKGGWSEK